MPALYAKWSSVLKSKQTKPRREHGASGGKRQDAVPYYSLHCLIHSYMQAVEA